MGVYDIQGINCVFQLKIGDDYKTVVCAKSFTFNPITDMKETTTVGSGFWKEYRPRRLSYTITFNGMFQVESAAQEKIKTMFDYQVGFLPLPYRLIYTDNSSNVMVVDGSAYVTSTLLDASPVNLVNGTVELQGNGPITVLDHVPDLANITIESLGDNSIVAQFQFKLFDANGAVVFDSGQLPGASGGNLTHPVNVTGQVQKGMYSIFWQAYAQSVGNAFQLDAPPTKTELFNDLLINESTFGVQEYDFTANRLVSFTLGVPAPPPVCVAPGFTSGLASPAATVGTYWLGTVILSGSQPFSISNVTKPAWMSMALAGNIITFEGNPVAGIDQVISFDVSNACGSNSYNDNIDVSSNPDGVTVQFNYTEDAGFPSAGCNARLYVNAALFLNFFTTNTATFIVNPGDVIEVQVVGASAAIKHIDVQDTIDGEIHNQTATGVTLTYTFATTIGHDYTINSTTENP